MSGHGFERGDEVELAVCDGGIPPGTKGRIVSVPDPLTVGIDWDGYWGLETGLPGGAPMWYHEWPWAMFKPSIYLRRPPAPVNEWEGNLELL